MKYIRTHPIISTILILLSLFLATGLALYSYQSSRILARTEVVISQAKPEPGLETVSFDSLRNLPAPVQKYFRLVLTDGQPILRKVRLIQEGELMVSPKGSKYIDFQALHWARADVPAFLWDASMAIAPAISIRVLDSYRAGTGSGEVLMLSMIKMGGQEDKPELNSAALYRYLAEAVWYPTALLPQNGVEWKYVDENRAMATLNDSGISVSLLFSFNERGEVTGIYTENRYGLFGDKFIQYPWEGKFRDYRRAGNVMIPFYAEVGWHLPDGFWLFWKGNIESASYD
ncbi:MAG: hypothetical protein RH862_16870 [Leptospiraceae bacterium]